MFLKLHNQELQPNVLQTIHDWFEKFGSYYTAEGIFFIADNEKKGKMIQKLIDEGLVEASTIKKDSIFLIEEEKKELFFDFIKSSQIFYYEKQVPIFPKSCEGEKDSPSLEGLHIILE